MAPILLPILLTVLGLVAMFTWVLEIKIRRIPPEELEAERREKERQETWRKNTRGDEP